MLVTRWKLVDVSTTLPLNWRGQTVQLSEQNEIREGAKRKLTWIVFLLFASTEPHFSTMPPYPTWAIMYGRQACAAFLTWSTSLKFLYVRYHIAQFPVFLRRLDILNISGGFKTPQYLKHWTKLGAPSSEVWIIILRVYCLLKLVEKIIWCELWLRSVGYLHLGSCPLETCRVQGLRDWAP